LKSKMIPSDRELTNNGVKMTKYEIDMCEITGIPVEEWRTAKRSHPELRYMYFQDLAEFRKYITEDYCSSETECRRHLYQALKAKLMGLYDDRAMHEHFSECTIETYKMLLVANIPKIKAWTNTIFHTGGRN